METTPTERHPRKRHTCTGAPIAGIFDRITSEAHDQRLLGGSVPAALPETPHALQADQVTSALLVDPWLGLTELERRWNVEPSSGPNLLKALRVLFSELTLLLSRPTGSPVAGNAPARYGVSLFSANGIRPSRSGVVLVISDDRIPHQAQGGSTP